MRYLVVKNFAKHQHYKDRRPPWIKLHVEVLDDYAFSCLQDASKAHLMLLWVLASKMDNRIPYDLVFLAKKLGATSLVDVEELVLQGFIEVAQEDSAALAPRKRSAMPETERESEAERESETELPRTPRKAARRDENADAFAQLWADYPKRAGSNPRQRALRAYTARRMAGVEHDVMAAGVARYTAFLRATGKEGSEFVMQAATFFGPDEHWSNPWRAPGGQAPSLRFAPSVTEEADRLHTNRVALEERYDRAAHRAGSQWAKEHPAEFAPIKALVDATFRGISGDFAAAAIKADLTQRCAKAAGFPSFDQWLDQSPQAGAA